MATIKIPYGGTTYSLFMNSAKITTPSIIVSGQGYIPLYTGGNVGDPVIWGQHILKKAPMKVTGNNTWYRPTWYHEQIGAATCDVYYKASYTLREGTQQVDVCTKYNVYGACISYSKQTQYRYYWDTNSNIHINNFAIANGDLRIVMSNFTCKGYNVLNTWSGWYSTKSNWGNWTASRWSSYPAKVAYTLNTSASGSYSLQININNTWVTIKTGTASCSFSVPINNENQQMKKVSLTLG